ncbi:MAG TPA: glycoside hydrolase family 2 TIM barrel-domain containing protein [Abditibacterium sp.]
MRKAAIKPAPKKVAAPAPVPTVPTLIQYLSGRDSANTVPWEFNISSGPRSNQWTTIPVPSNWELQGFSELRYGFGDQGKAPVTGSYRHSFSVPAEWDGRRVFIVFDGAMTDTEVKINGQSAGPIHQGAFYRFQYDITDKLKRGEPNLLEVAVTDQSSNASIQGAERVADFWIFGGLFRPVFLKAVPQQYINRVALDAKANGSFRSDVYLGGTGPATSVETTLVDAAGKPVGAPMVTPVAAGATVARVEGQFANPALWTAETPNLYTAVYRLKQGNRILHETRERLGFRTLEVRAGDGFYVNGKRVLLKGVNRHSFWPTTGRALNDSNHLGDIALMKEMNMNAVRSSHYPPDKRFLDLCDEKGLYVIDELTGWQKAYDTPGGTPLVKEMLERDINHPSIILWANGNEGGWNTELDHYYPEIDLQQRQVIHPWAKYGPMNTKHYPTYKALTDLLATGDVILPTEILHGLYDGGHGAALEDYWEAIRTSKTGAGCFLWLLTDEGVQIPGTERIDVKGNAAPDGIVGPFHEKEGSFYTIQEIWSPIRLPRTLPAGFTGTLPVENRYDFTNLSATKFKWELRKLGEKAGFTVISEGTVNGPNLAPAASGSLALPLPATFRTADVLAVTPIDYEGRAIRTITYPLQSATTDVTRMVTMNNPVTPTTTGDTTEFVAGQTRLRVNATTGQLNELSVNGQPFALTSGPIAGAKWSMDNSGWIRLDYTVPAGQTAAQEIGVSFSYPETQMRSKTWEGMGPYRVWRNRQVGPTQGVWETAYNNTITGFNNPTRGAKGWVYPEYGGYFADVRWARVATTQGDLTLVVPTEKNFVRIGTPQQASGDLPRRTAVTIPAGNIAVLRDIPGIGTKTTLASEMGPQSTTPIVTEAYSDTVYFRVSPSAAG